MSDEVEFGDIEPDDAYDPDDGSVDWSQVDKAQEQIDAINAVEDDSERVQAAQRWVKEMSD